MTCRRLSYTSDAPRNQGRFSTVPFPYPFDRSLVAAFDQTQASSDVGAVLLKAADRALDLIAAQAQPRLTGGWAAR